jgi:succinyl-CoA synthetase alpha subunit
MSVLVTPSTRLIVQGITGKEGLFHAKGCRDYGTLVVGGVTPGKGEATFTAITTQLGCIKPSCLNYYREFICGTPTLQLLF